MNTIPWLCENPPLPRACNLAVARPDEQTFLALFASELARAGYSAEVLTARVNAVRALLSMADCPPAEITPQHFATLLARARAMGARPRRIEMIHRGVRAAFDEMCGRMIACAPPTLSRDPNEVAPTVAPPLRDVRVPEKKSELERPPFRSRIVSRAVPLDRAAPGPRAPEPAVREESTPSGPRTVPLARPPTEGDRLKKALRRRVRLIRALAKNCLESSEIAALTWDAVDLERCLVTVPLRRTPGHRHVVLPAEAAARLRRARAEARSATGWVFPGEPAARHIALRTVQRIIGLGEPQSAGAR